MEMPSRREHNKQQCRARILKASRQLFSAQGFEQTTMEEVALRAEVSKATLYNYFTNKDSLLMGIAEAALDEIRQLVAVELKDEHSALTKLRRVMQTFVLDSVRYLALCRKITYLRSDIDPQQIVDLLIGVYFTTQFQWPEIETYAQEECLEKLNGLFDLTLAGVCTA